MLSRITMIQIDRYPALEGLGNGLTMRKATREDLIQAAEFNPEQLSVSFVNEALAKGDYCAAAFDGEQMVAWAWASFDSAPHGDGLRVKVEAPFSYGYKWFTKPEYRGRGIIGPLANLRDQLGAETGVTHNVGFTETHNYASQRSSQRLGAIVVGYAGYLKFFGKAYPFRSRGAASHSFRFYREPL